MVKRRFLRHRNINILKDKQGEQGLQVFVQPVLPLNAYFVRFTYKHSLQ